LSLPSGARVLFVRLSAFGDVALELPALFALRAARPDLHLAWVVEDRCAALLEGLPALDELIVMPRGRWRELRRERGRTAALAAMRRFGADLGSGRWDAALDFQGNLKSGLVTRASRARRRLGFARGATREPNWLFTRERVAIDDPRTHRRERDFRLLEALDESLVLPRDPRIDFGLREDERAWAQGLASGASGPLMVVHPGTAAFFAQKRWPLERYAALIDRMAEERGVRTVLSYGPGHEEAERRDAVRELCQSPLILPDEPPSLRQLIALFDRADLILGSDTGPVHLASVMGRPTVILFGPYDPGPLHPFGHPERGRYAALPCSPCRYRDCPRALCMEEITEVEVRETVRAILDGDKAPEGATHPNKTVPV
jgi:lipopolysaccharide heptosyltransferase I